MEWLFEARRCALVVVLVLAGVSHVPVFAQRAEVEDGFADVVDGAAPGRQPGGADDASNRTADLQRVERRIVELTNRFRAENGRAEVKSNERLASAAEYFAEYMARTGRYGHTADGSGPSQRAQKHGYGYCLVSENIAYQYSSAGFEAEQLTDRLTENPERHPLGVLAFAAVVARV